MKRYIIYFLLLIMGFALQAQELTVVSMQPTMEVLPVNMLHKDLNGEYCGVLYVQTSEPGLKFQGNVIGDVDFESSQYTVHLTSGSKSLRIMGDNFLPTTIQFANQGIDKIESKRVYVLRVNIPYANLSIESINDKLPITVKGITFNMVHVDGGTFTMGERPPKEEKVYGAVEPHKVTLRDFYIGETEVSQGLWEAVMGKNPSKPKGSDLPVNFVSFEDCQAFITKLNKLTGRTFAFPTDAQWEFAARGGNKSESYKFSGDDDPNKVSWYKDNSDNTPHPIAMKKPNELGLYDMSGNMSEFCSDWYGGEYSNEEQTDPTGPASGTYRISRGGSFQRDLLYVYVVSRPGAHPKKKFEDHGLRLVLNP